VDGLNNIGCGIKRLKPLCRSTKDSHEGLVGEVASELDWFERRLAKLESLRLAQASSKAAALPE
jgi:hypothetical protein